MWPVHSQQNIVQIMHATTMRAVDCVGVLAASTNVSGSGMHAVTPRPTQCSPAQASLAQRVKVNVQESQERLQVVSAESSAYKAQLVTTQAELQGARSDLLDFTDSLASLKEEMQGLDGDLEALFGEGSYKEAVASALAAAEAASGACSPDWDHAGFPVCLRMLSALNSEASRVRRLQLLQVASGACCPTSDRADASEECRCHETCASMVFAWTCISGCRAAGTGGFRRVLLALGPCSLPVFEHVLSLWGLPLARHVDALFAGSSLGESMVRQRQRIVAPLPVAFA